MSVLVVAASLGLAASLPVAALCWAAGAGVERLTRAPRLRERVWTMALAVCLLIIGVTVTAAAVAGEPEAASVAAPEGAAVAHVLAGAWGAVPASRFDLPFEAAWLAVLLMGVSVAGLAHRALRLELGRRRLAALVRGALPLQDPALLTRLHAEAARLRVRTPELLMSDEADRPLLVGIRRAAILLPTPLVRAVEADRLSLICAHELAHLARSDNLRLALEELAAGLLWFNPAFHAVRARLRAAREEVCDASALEGAPASVRRLYADTLTHTLRPGVGLEPRTAFTGAARSTAMRLHAILTPARPARARTAVAAGAACLGLLSVAGASSVALAQVASAAAPGLTVPFVTGASPLPVSSEAKFTVRRSGSGAVTATPSPGSPATDRALQALAASAVQAATEQRPGSRMQATGAASTAPPLSGSSPARFTVRRSRSGPVTAATSPGSTATDPALQALAVSAVQAVAEQRARSGAHATEAKPKDAYNSFNCPPPGVCMSAERFHLSDGVSTYTGSPMLYGTTVIDGQLLIDGRPQPAGVDMSIIDPATIDRIEVTKRTPDGRPEPANTDRSTVKATINVITTAGR